MQRQTSRDGLFWSRMQQQSWRPIDTNGVSRLIELSCQRCGSRMLSKGVGNSLHALICSNCGAPANLPGNALGQGRALSGLVLVAMGGFVVLLLFLTGLGRVGMGQVTGESLIEKIGSGERGSLSQD